MKRPSRSSKGNPVFLQTIADRLRVLRNDYSTIEALFQSGPGLAFVDTRTGESVSANLAYRASRARDAFTLPILRGGASVPTVSLIIPVYGGGDVLSECIESISNQSFVIERPDNVELIIVEDGIPNEEASVFENDSVQRSLRGLRELQIQLKLLRLKTNQGRAQARNAGLGVATHDLVFLVDGSMVLDKDFILEHVWRHARIKQPLALVGFKENIDWADFKAEKAEIIGGRRRPDFRKDWKWNHTLKLSETGERGFSYARQRFASGDNINYCDLTRGLKKLSGSTQIGLRTLPSFFQTNIVSAYRLSILDVGGFEPSMQIWGLEDTFLGALLVAHGCFLVPCPSAVAFNIEQELSGASEKDVDLELNRLKYEELILKTRMDEYTSKKFQHNYHLLDRKLEFVNHDVAKSTRIQTSQPPVGSPVTLLSQENTETDIVSLPQILAWGWDGGRLLEDISRLDYATMEGLIATAAGTPQQWTSVFLDHPDSWRVLASRSPSVAGYWHFVSLLPEDFAAAMSGKLLDKDITADRIQSFELPGIYNIYFAGLAIHPMFRNHQNLNRLLLSFFEVLRSLARDKIFIERLCTNAFTSYGVSVCKTLRLRYVTHHFQKGEIYATTVNELLNRPLGSDFEDLRKLYETRFGGPK